jgi:dienelactone hydrolase
MKLQRLVSVFVFLAIVARTPAIFADDKPYEPTKGKYEVETLRIVWHDKKRDRDVPVKIYYPKDAKGPVPLIIFSHGLGGSRDGYSYLGNEWASHGYVSAHVQHLGSDTAALKTAMTGGLQEALKPYAASNRIVDIYYAIAALEHMNGEPGPLHGKVDMDHIGVAGHSYGAWTTLVVGGEVIIKDGVRFNAHHHEPRIKALIPMSAPVPEKVDLDTVFSGITLPCLHMTGTLDDSPIAETKAADRRLPYDHMTAKVADEYLLTFKGGDHMVFSGRGSQRSSRAAHDAIFQKYIKESSDAFWDAYLKDDHAAKTWLATGGFKKDLDGEGTFEEKLAK